MATWRASIVSNPPPNITRADTNNILLVNEFCRGAHLFMRRPAQTRDRKGAHALRWRVIADLVFTESDFDARRVGAAGSAEALVNLPPIPGARELDGTAPLQLSVGPVTSDRRLVAVAYFPEMVRGIRFSFACDPPEDPDGFAEVWAMPFTTAHLRSGFYTAPEAFEIGKGRGE